MKPFEFNITSYRVGGEYETFASICQASGADGIEFWPWAVEEETTYEEVKTIAKTYLSRGVVPDTYHLPFWKMCNPADQCEKTRKEGVDILCSRIEKIADLGIAAAILHPDGQDSGSSAEDEKLSIRQLEKSLEKILPAAEKAGIRIALENMPPKNGNRLAARPEYMARLAEAFKHSMLGFCLDTGHAAMAGGLDGAKEMFEAMGKRIFAFHLHDNPGDRDMHLAPGRGLFNWNAFFKRAAESKFTGRMTIEAPPFAEGPPYPLEAWKMLVADTKHLAEKAFPSLVNAAEIFAEE